MDQHVTPPLKPFRKAKHVNLPLFEKFVLKEGKVHSV